jgi:hypothetical protein
MSWWPRAMLIMAAGHAGSNADEADLFSANF